MREQCKMYETELVKLSTLAKHAVPSDSENQFKEQIRKLKQENELMKDEKDKLYQESRSIEGALVQAKVINSK